MQEVINKITPSKKEREQVDSLIKNFFKKLKLKDAIPEIGGSMAKDTWLSGDYDIDVFVKFPYKMYKNKDISKELQNRLKNIKYEVLHGSRDYLQIKQGKFLFELIPVISINHSSKHLNITDVSPLHAKFVKEFNKNPEQIRLAKAFLKANNLYGAESYIKGFSGYITELLVINYGSFQNLIKAASRWKQTTIIDMSNHYKSKEEILKNLNKDKITNLILIDPVQPERNAGTALSEEKYLEFIETCKSYLRNPSNEFFELKEFNIKKLKEKKNKNKLVMFTIKALDGKPDVVGSKILKVFNYIKNKISEEGYKVLEGKWQWKEEALLYYIVKDEKLSDKILHYGPFKKDIENVKNFKKKWKKVYFDNERAYTKIKRKYKTINAFNKQFLKDNFIKERVKKIELDVY